jgi:hypothetical protein
MGELTLAEQEMIDAIAAAFAGRCFDTSSIMGAVQTNPRLDAALSGIIPPARRNGPRLRERRARRALTQMAARNLFTTDWQGWWRLPRVAAE